MKQVTIDGEKVWVFENRTCRVCSKEGPETIFHGFTCHSCADAEFLNENEGFR